MFKREKDEFRFEPIQINTLVGRMGGNIQQGGGKAKLGAKRVVRAREEDAEMSQRRKKESHETE